jgi:hypothetical protein
MNVTPMARPIQARNGLLPSKREAKWALKRGMRRFFGVIPDRVVLDVGPLCRHIGQSVLYESIGAGRQI